MLTHFITEVVTDPRNPTVSQYLQSELNKAIAAGYSDNELLIYLSRSVNTLHQQLFEINSRLQGIQYDHG